ncbi:MAG TPA: MarR family transcriptional regulator [Polyangiaceae bacterium]|nr:MarR family transcriptional regulator [Polyangiaceae bacterium]
MRWRRAVERALVGTGLTFTQWLVLDALRELIAETRDAAIQNEIAARVELDRGTTSLVMRTLEKKGFVDRAPDITGRALRIWLTDPAEVLLREQAAGIEAASWGAER